MPKPDEVVVIGGSGFIGSCLVPLLRQDGSNVTVVSRQAGLGRSQEPGLRYVRAAAGDEQAMMRVIEGALVVYHLAMGGGDTWADYQRDFVDSARYVANACLAHGVRRLIWTGSTAGLYLGRRGTMDESDGADPKPLLRSDYSRGKVEAERVLLEAHAQRGLPVVIMRPAIVVGRGGFLCHGGIGVWAADTCCLGWGRGDHPLPFVLVQDVAQGLYLAKDKPGIDGMAFNLAGDVRPSAAEYLRIVRQRSLRNFRFYPQSLVKLRTVELLKWVVKRLAGRRDAALQSYYDMKSRSMRTQMDCSLAKRVLGWNPNASMEVFLREAIDCHLPPIAEGDLRRTEPRAGEIACAQPS